MISSKKKTTQCISKYAIENIYLCHLPVQNLCYCLPTHSFIWNSLTTGRIARISLAKLTHSFGNAAPGVFYHRGILSKGKYLQKYVQVCTNAHGVR